jgi:hypothetical protein
MLNQMKIARPKVSSGTAISCDDYNWQKLLALNWTSSLYLCFPIILLVEMDTSEVIL